MKNVESSCRGALSTSFVVVAAMLAAPPADAQLDLTGNWSPPRQEDRLERGPGPALVDYLGLPINRQGRQFALSWNPSRYTLPEHQCQVHTVGYIYRGPLRLRIWEERNPDSQELIAINQYISTYEQSRTIWMDGRPHPSQNAPHTWMGFSTGEWIGNKLRVRTTHIKQGWHRRNGLPSSDRMELIEYFAKHGDVLTHITIANDPVFLEEPLIKNQSFRLNDDSGANWLWPCEYVVEVADQEQGDVPHYLPGENPFIAEFAQRHGIPVEAALGGPETTRPEYIETLRAWQAEQQD